MHILPYAVWSYLPRIKASMRGEIELPDALRMMIEDGYKAFGFLQPAPKEWNFTTYSPLENS
jgi:dTDP-glucose pyrophosphorylase